MNYRYDLQLLKGVTILYIIMYHNGNLVRYGYLSVIVFINISGYLSNIKIINAPIKNIFNRFKRITPSYYTIISVTVFYSIYKNSLNENDVKELYYLFSYTYNIMLINNGDDYFRKDNKPK